MEKLYKEICDGRDVRKNLISLRQMLKDVEKKRSFAYLLGGDFQVIADLLGQEDPKVRKNAALVLGEMETEDVLPFLFAAYQRETTLFVRADYLRAMALLDYRPYLEKLKTRLETLRKAEVEEDDRKHVREEIRWLQEMILKYEKPKKHVFAAYDPAPELLLVTNRLQKDVVEKQITTGSIKGFGQGFRIKNGNLRELLPIRCYLEILFFIPGAHPLSGSAEQIGKSLRALKLEEYLRDLHRTGGCFYYRIDVRSAMPLEKKGTFIRRIAGILDEESAGLLRNSSSDYEVELRLVERRDGSFLPLLKLYTLPDHRFDYRKETVASSIHPVNAALTVQLAKPYLKENAQILDPFCGVGTMLLERNKEIRANPMYGLDIFGEAVEKARRNTAREGSVVHYINRDFFDFTHEYLFDEIITDMPRFGAETGEQSASGLYQRFFASAPRVLKKHAVLILYTMEPDLVREGVSEYPKYHILEEYLLSEKNHASVFILQLEE